MKNCAHRQSRGRVVFLRDYRGMSGCVPDYWCNVGDYYLSRYVCSYLGGRGGSHVGASAACVISMSQIWIHQDSVFRIRS